MTTKDLPVASSAVSFTETPEFQAAVAKAVAEAISKALPKSNDEDWTQRLAMAIADLTDQNAPAALKRISPEILAFRASAREKMGALIVAVRTRRESLSKDERKKDRSPAYRVLNALYLNERRVEPFRKNLTTGKSEPTVITYTGVPNELMYPLDDEARAIYTAFKQSIGMALDNDGPANKPKPVWLTAGGLIVHGDAPASIGQTDINTSSLEELNLQIDKRFSDELSVPMAVDPNASFVNILGTIQPAARQGYAGIDEAAA